MLIHFRNFSKEDAWSLRLATAQMYVGWEDGREGRERCKEKVKCLNHLPGFSRREGCVSEQLEASSEVRTLPSWG